MRTIPEVVENIKNILNDAERTQDGECLVEIDDLVNEILVINSSQTEKIVNTFMTKAIGWNHNKTKKVPYEFIKHVAEEMGVLS